MKELVLTRVPPGDRWKDVKAGDGAPILMDSLTEGLNHIYQRTRCQQYYIDAGKGEVFMEDGKVEPTPVKQYSIYGEEIG
jgi:hypothetical protein